MKDQKFTPSDFAKSLAERIKPPEKLSVVDWILKNNIKTEDGLPFDFTKRKFLIDFYNDLSPQQAIRASAQVG